MAYTDTAYYKGTYKGTVIPDGELENLLSSASDDIDSMVFYRIGGDTGFTALTAFQQEQVRKAVCVQADYLHDFGDIAALGVNRYNVGDVSVSMGNGGSTGSPQVKRLLMPTGLLNRGVKI